MHIPQINLSIVCKRNLSVNKTFWNKLFLFCNWWIGNSPNSTWMLKSFPCSFWCTDRWYGWYLLQCNIWITSEQLIPEPCEIYLIQICGFVGVHARPATSFASYITGLIQQWIVVFQIPVPKNIWQISCIVWTNRIFWSGYLSLYSCHAVAAFLLHSL